MKHILSQPNRDVLEKFAASNVLMAFDYDGTLAPIVDEPERAMMRNTTRERLGGLTKLYPCIVISGRAQDDVLRKMHGLGIREAIGNHGLEPWHASNPLLRRVQTWVPLLERRLVSFEGVRIENKLFSVAIHYRHADQPRRAHAAILRAVKELGNIRIVPGKMVLNVLPEDAPHKGFALERARERLGCERAVYVGDDATDEDVFGLAEPDRILTIRVGRNRSSKAQYCLRDQCEIDSFLEVLLDLRQTTTLNRDVGSCPESQR